MLSGNNLLQIICAQLSQTMTLNNLNAEFWYWSHAFSVWTAPKIRFNVICVVHTVNKQSDLGQRSVSLAITNSTNDFYIFPNSVYDNYLGARVCVCLCTRTCFFHDPTLLEAITPCNPVYWSGSSCYLRPVMNILLASADSNQTWTSQQRICVSFCKHSLTWIL